MRLSAHSLDLPLEVTPTNANALLVAGSGAGRIAVFDLESQTGSELWVAVEDRGWLER